MCFFALKCPADCRSNCNFVHPAGTQRALDEDRTTVGAYEPMRDRRLRLGPRTCAEYIERATEYLVAGDHESAIFNYTEAIRLDPQSAVAYLNRGRAYVELGEGGRAIADLSEAIRLDPTNATAFVHRGRAYDEDGDRNRAKAEYTEAIRLAQLDPRAANT